MTLYLFNRSQVFYRARVLLAAAAAWILLFLPASACEVYGETIALKDFQREWSRGDQVALYRLTSDFVESSECLAESNKFDFASVFSRFPENNKIYQFHDPEYLNWALMNSVLRLAAVTDNPKMFVELLDQIDQMAEKDLRTLYARSQIFWGRFEYDFGRLPISKEQRSSWSEVQKRLSDEVSISYWKRAFDEGLINPHRDLIKSACNNYYPLSQTRTFRTMRSQWLIDDGFEKSVSLLEAALHDEEISSSLNDPIGIFNMIGQVLLGCPLWRYENFLASTVSEDRSRALAYFKKSETIRLRGVLIPNSRGNGFTRVIPEPDANMLVVAARLVDELTGDHVRAGNLVVGIGRSIGMWGSPSPIFAAALSRISPEAMRAAQIELSDMGYFKGEIDGTYGEATETALMTLSNECNSSGYVNGIYQWPEFCWRWRLEKSIFE